MFWREHGGEKKGDYTTFIQDGRTRIQACNAMPKTTLKLAFFSEEQWAERKGQDYEMAAYSWVARDVTKNQT